MTSEGGEVEMIPKPHPLAANPPSPQLAVDLPASPAWMGAPIYASSCRHSSDLWTTSFHVEGSRGRGVPLQLRGENV